MTLTEDLPIEGAKLNWVDHLPETLPGAARLGAYLQAMPGDLLVDFPRVARFRVREGRWIDVAVAEGGSRETASYFARVTPFGALVHERGELPLHSSAVRAPGGGALLIAGASGAGKSTTAAALVARGWTVLADDLSRLTVEGDTVRVWPGFRALKLWEKSCRMLGLDSAGLEQPREELEKFYWHAATADAPEPVRALVELHRGDQECQGPERLRGAEAMCTLARQTFRPRLVKPLGCTRTHFDRIGEVVRRVPCYRIINSHAIHPWELAARLEGLAS